MGPLQVKNILAKYPSQYKAGATIPLLHLAQKQVGWLPLAAMNKVAKLLEIPPMKVYETATFYSMFLREPVGKNIVGVCMTTPCMLCNSESVYEAISDQLGIHFGGEFFLSFSLSLSLSLSLIRSPLVLL